MKHPFEDVPRPVFRWLMLASLTGTLVFAVVLGAVGARFSARTGPGGESYDILDFEFAGTPERVEKIFQVWGAPGIAAARRQTWLDFLFLLCYATLLVLFVVNVVARPAPDSAGWLRAGRVIAWGQWLAGLFDALENVALLVLLYRPASPATPWPQLAAVCAAVKFSLLAAGAVFIVVAVPRRVKRRVARIA